VSKGTGSDGRSSCPGDLCQHEPAGLPILAA
jgi:hypothetical protein